MNYIDLPYTVSCGIGFIGEIIFKCIKDGLGMTMEGECDEDSSSNINRGWTRGVGKRGVRFERIYIRYSRKSHGFPELFYVFPTIFYFFCFSMCFF